MSFELVVDLYLYPTEESGRRATIQNFYRPNGFLRKDTNSLSHGLIFHVGQIPIAPGERRRLVCGFTYKESFDAFMSAKKFYIWDAKFIGETTLVESNNSN